MTMNKANKYHEITSCKQDRKLDASRLAWWSVMDMRKAEGSWTDERQLGSWTRRKTAEWTPKYISVRVEAGCCTCKQAPVSLAGWLAGTC